VQAAMASGSWAHGSVQGDVPTTNGLRSGLQAIAGAMAKGTGTKVFWLQTGGFDTHASQDTNSDPART